MTKTDFVFQRFKEINIAGKEENAGYIFFFSPHCFQKPSVSLSLKFGIVKFRVNQSESIECIFHNQTTLLIRHNILVPYVCVCIIEVLPSCYFKKFNFVGLIIRKTGPLTELRTSCM